MGMLMMAAALPLVAAALTVTSYEWLFRFQMACFLLPTVVGVFYAYCAAKRE
jgi:hypothetical protein